LFGAVAFFSSYADLSNILIEDNSATSTGGMGFSGSIANITNGRFVLNVAKKAVRVTL
jgi:hypothetical protein